MPCARQSRAQGIRGLLITLPQGAALGYGDIGLSARFCLSFDTPSSYRLPLIYNDKYDHILSRRV